MKREAGNRFRAESSASRPLFLNHLRPEITNMTGRSDDSLCELAPKILSHQVTALVLLDHELNLRYLNTAAEILFSVSAHRVVGKAMDEALPRPAESIRQHLDSVFKNQQPLTERETVLQFDGGRSITADCSLIPMVEERGNPMVLIEIRQVDRQLRLSREERLISQNAATRVLIRGMAHEIRNPLGGLRGAAQLLAMELKNGDLKEYTQVIIEEADRLGALLDQMLGSRQLPVKKPLNIHHVLERVATIVESDAENRIELIRDYDPSIPELEGDEGQLIQAILNIVRNAVQATRGAGRIQLQTRVQRQFTLASTRHRLVAQIDIIDDGPGIPQKLRERVFYPMVTNKAEGSGLGLSIAQSLVNRHGGLIEFTSRPGRTKFTVYLPLGEPS